MSTRWNLGVCALALLLAILALHGCGTSTRSTAQTDTVLSETLIINGTVKVPFSTAEGTNLYELPLSLRVQRNSSQISKSDAAAQTKIEAPEIGALIAAAIKHAFPVAGAFMGPAEKAKDWTAEIITGGGAAALLVQQMLAARKRLSEKDDEIAHHRAKEAAAKPEKEA